MCSNARYIIHANNDDDDNDAWHIYLHSELK